MCIRCGCGSRQPQSEPGAGSRSALKSEPPAHWHQHTDGNWHTHVHADAAQGHFLEEPALEPAHGHPHRGTGPDAQLAHDRWLRVERDILAKNDAIAERNRQRLAQGSSLALNLVSSPGAGKTSLLCRTIERIGGSFPVLVIEGDQQTSIDADRIRATGVPALQINTGKGCHLEAEMVERALAQLDPPQQALVMIENVGNLVCPAAFDLGEDAKVVVLSVTEGDDKPLKYPDMFAAAQLMLVNKIDLQPHCDFDLARAFDYARRVNPGIEAIAVSARDGTGFEEWLAWLDTRRKAKQTRGRVGDCAQESGHAEHRPLEPVPVGPRAG